MANFGLGLAQGFELGTRMQEAYRKRRMREEFEAAQADKQRPKYTPEQGAQMRAEAGTVEQPGEYEYTIEPGSTTYTRRRRGLSAEDEAQLLAAEAARDQQGRPYYSVTRGPEGATVRGLTPTEGGGFNTIGPDTSDPRDVLNYPYISNAERLNYIGEGGYTGPQSDMRRLQSEAIAAREEEMLRPARFPVGVIPGSESTVSPGATQYLDQTYGAEGLTPTQQRAALMNRYADIISKYESPAEGEKFRSLARAEERAEKAFELNTQLTNFQISQAARTDKEATELEKLSEAATAYRKDNPNATPMDIVNHVTATVKPSPAALTKYVASVAQVDAADLQLMNSSIDRKIRGKSLAGMIKLYNDDDMFDPNTNMVEEKGPKGEVVLKVVDSKDPSKVLETFSFKDPTTARDFLINSAKNPGQQAQWLRTMQLQEDQGVYYRAKAERAAGGGLRQGRDYTNVERIQEINGLVRHRDSAARDAARLREDVNNMRPNDPNYAQTVARYNAADALVQQLDKDIRALRGGGGGGGLRRDGGGEPAPKVGQIYIVPDPKTGEDMRVRLKKGDGSREEDWEILQYERSKGGKTISGPITKPGENLPTVESPEEKKKKQNK